MWFGNGRIAPVLQVLTMAAPLAAPQLIECRLDTQEGAQTVDPPRFFESVGRLVGDRGAVQHTGVVDQGAQRAELVDGGGDGLLPLRRRRHVERNRDHRVVAQAVDRGVEIGRR